MAKPALYHIIEALSLRILARVLWPCRCSMSASIEADSKITGRSEPLRDTFIPPASKRRPSIYIPPRKRNSYQLRFFIDHSSHSIICRAMHTPQALQTARARHWQTDEAEL